MKNIILLCLAFLTLWYAVMFADTLISPKPVTIVQNGITWTRVKQSDLTRRLEAGDRVYVIDKKGKATAIQLKKIDTAGKDTVWALTDTATGLPITSATQQ